MTISEWVDKREMTGFPTFSYTETCRMFPALSSQAVSNELYRLGKRMRIQAVHKGFYIAVPIQYRENGVVPPYIYIIFNVKEEEPREKLHKKHVDFDNAMANADWI